MPALKKVWWDEEEEKTTEKNEMQTEEDFLINYQQLRQAASINKSAQALKYKTDLIVIFKFL